ncbi:hypothetical protein T4B_3861 [Trichinella pseudospiralis]|uniref:Uncharacterized protein n=1 Tax=Trichinella pseudospiralis TaxID=6337 RepID=A0A0V1ECX0_TRIPS|nr:hypothetical protein T4A_6407 [Trichinella pseudospiralis]KRZ22916.1 hypothetical protein T4B_3861 [Trichinella pseudospiralis]KRZ39740.1 hypothetical protein T4C_8401 [Trichinella pseudospiralis]
MNGHHCQLENSYKRTNINYICPDIAEKCHKRTAFLAIQFIVSYRKNWEKVLSVQCWRSVTSQCKRFNESHLKISIANVYQVIYMICIFYSTACSICRTDCAELETLHQLTPHQCGGCDASIVLRCLSIELQAILQQSNQQQHCIEKFE